MKFKPTGNPGGVMVELGPQECALPSGGTAPSQTPLPVFNLKQILVPIDFSDCSIKALEYALPLAEQFGARLRLMYVAQAVYPVAALGPLDLASLQAGERAEAEEKLTELARKVIGDRARSEILVATGQPSDEIARIAGESETDLIVISTHGHTGLKHLWLGSIAEGVVRKAPCPVLVVREKEHEFVNKNPS
jgi:nucleotide-binding universal stress UspA family protein